MAVTNTSHPTRRELARRSNDGIEVTLWWDPHTGAVTLTVQDRSSGEHFELDIDGNSALDAFHHPYAHATAGPMRHAISEAR